MSQIELWSRAFGLTFVIEALVAFPLLDSAQPRWRRIGAIFAAQLLTHPSVWFILPSLGWSRLAYMATAEAWAVVGEMLLYRLVFAGLPWRRSFGISAVANGASVLAGVWLR